ncbi:Pectin lyase fold/virulence factor [Penicillium expansum]|nr:Pectin lyase fold/virulence factor [Penicillium expansum]
MRGTLTLFVLFAFCLNLIWASAAADPAFHLWHQRRAIAHPPRPRSLNTSTSDLWQAQKLVEAAVAQQSEYNAWRVANPKRNTYQSRHFNATRSSTQHKRSNQPVAPTLNPRLRAAAALSLLSATQHSS